MTPSILSLCSGIGGLNLAAAEVGDERMMPLEHRRRPEDDRGMQGL